MDADLRAFLVAFGATFDAEDRVVWTPEASQLANRLEAWTLAQQREAFDYVLAHGQPGCVADELWSQYREGDVAS